MHFGGRLFSSREKELKPLSLRERGWGEGANEAAFPTALANSGSATLITIEPTNDRTTMRRRGAACLLALAALGLASCASISANAPAPATDMAAAAEPEAGWQTLFDGHNLDGWRASEHPDSFRVEDGQIVVKGERSHLFYVGPVGNHDFRDFELKLEVMTFPGANSGVYFHTAWQDGGWPSKGYEVQVNNTQSDPKRTAGLYAVQDNFEAPAADNTWFEMTIRVQGKHVATFVDGKQIVDYTEPADPQRPADMAGRVLGSGTIALQAHDPGSEVHYRNIRIRLL